MSAKIKAADDIRNLARLYKNMLSVADELDGIGSLEQVKAECAQAAQQAKDAKDAALNQLAEAHLHLAEIETAALLAATRADENATTVLTNAGIKADAIVSAAKQQSKRNESDAQDRANQIYQAALGRKAELTANVQELQATAQALAADADAQRTELQRLTEAIAKARAVMANLMGA